MAILLIVGDSDEKHFYLIVIQCEWPFVGLPLGWSIINILAEREGAKAYLAKTYVEKYLPDSVDELDEEMGELRRKCSEIVFEKTFKDSLW